MDYEMQVLLNVHDWSRSGLKTQYFIYACSVYVFKCIFKDQKAIYFYQESF